MNTINPTTVALEQVPELPDWQDELFPLLFGWYFTYTATNVTENQAPKAKEASPPRKLTTKT